MRTLEHVVLGILLVHLLRLWWRLNRRKVKQWVQRVKDLQQPDTSH